MKKILFGLIFIGLSQTGFAEEGKPDPARFEKHKKMMLEEVDARITAIQSLKTCISGAKAQEDIEKCRHAEQDSMKKHREEMQAKMKEHKKEAIDDRIKKLQDEKSKLEEKK
jgi:predicted nuclease with TOPRIM domain